MIGRKAAAESMPAAVLYSLHLDTCRSGAVSSYSCLSYFPLAMVVAPPNKVARLVDAAGVIVTRFIVV